MKVYNRLKFKDNRFLSRSFCFLLFLILFTAGANSRGGPDEWESKVVKGIVFHDKTGNGHYVAGEDEPLEGVAVSNGRETVITDKEGSYQLPLRDNSFIFVIKPRNWMVPVDEHQLPRFYFIHSMVQHYF